MPDQIVPPAEPVTPPANEPPKETPPVTPAPSVVEEAKYKAAVREMNIKQQEAALLRKELDLMKQQLNGMQPMAPQPPLYQEPPEHVKRQLEEQFGLPYQQIELMNRMLELKNKDTVEFKAKLDEIENALAEDRYESTKHRLKAEDPIFEEFMPEIEAKLNLLPVKKRTNKDELAKIKSEVINAHMPDIIKMAEERGRQSVTARPPAPPEVNIAGGGSTPATPSPKTTHLTAEQKAYIERSGGSVQAVEEFVSGKVKPQSRWGSYTAE